MPLPVGANGGSWRALCSVIGSFWEHTIPSRLQRRDELIWVSALGQADPRFGRFPSN